MNLYGDTGDLLHFWEALSEGLANMIIRNCVAGVPGKRFLLVLESRVASPGHLRREMQPLRGGSSEQKRTGSRVCCARRTRPICKFSSKFVQMYGCTHLNEIDPISNRERLIIGGGIVFSTFCLFAV